MFFIRLAKPKMAIFPTRLLFGRSPVTISEKTVCYRSRILFLHELLPVFSSFLGSSTHLNIQRMKVDGDEKLGAKKELK